MRRLISLIGVGSRDGLQNIKRMIPPEAKAEYINMHLQAGFRSVEVGSFVSDKIVQMRDSREVIGMIKRPSYPVNLIVLVGNGRYAEEAVGYPIDSLAVSHTISEKFCQANNGSDIQKNRFRIKEIAKIASRSGKGVRGYLSCVFGCPYEGYVEEYPKRTARAVKEMLEEDGCYEVSLGDTPGTATTSRIISTFAALEEEKIDLSKIAIHLHDRQGRAKQNLVVSLARGVRVVDCGVGKIGGCNNIPDPSSNIEASVVLDVASRFKLDHTITDVEMIERAAQYIQKHI
jgi:hydroxymethylglutaryl-CoA lyase